MPRSDLPQREKRAEKQEGEASGVVRAVNILPASPVQNGMSREGWTHVHPNKKMALRGGGSDLPARKIMLSA
ncbi:MAG: hypothetical protein CVU39_01295 [Chloroflexi bacterium HGW-Chloroflexi-10]|nr:MAG: hypothetical protein CVU39_01295 [Chloroflexi bacterium HGW-Chloroflexi-10]